MHKVVTFSLFLLLTASGAGLTAQTRIMPLGNSITTGVGSTGNNQSYRKPLWNLLSSTYSVDFVGTLHDGSGFDADHDGHLGWRADQMLSNVSVWLNTAAPDMVLFEIATNDISARRATSQIISDINGILDKIWQYRSSVRVFMCTTIPRTTPYDFKTVELNTQIKSLVSQLESSHPINLVDQYTAISNTSNWQTSVMSDSIHPNNSGYQIMANTFFNVLRNFLSPITPVELTSFNAVAATNGVLLRWMTASETNNLGFRIEHRFAEGDFEEVGFVPGFGTTTDPHTYDFRHRATQPGRHGYRLKQIDTDGSFEYSDIVEVVLAAPDRFALLPSYPNPFAPGRSAQGFATISLKLPAPAPVRVSIFDILGREVARVYDGTKSAGTHSMSWNGRNTSGTLVSSGTYFIVARSPGGTRRARLQVIR